MSLEGAQGLALGDVPEPRRPIIAPGEHAPAIGRERDRAQRPDGALPRSPARDRPPGPRDAPPLRHLPTGPSTVWRQADASAQVDVCPENTRSATPLSMSHSRSVRSSPPESARRPSGEKVTQRTRSTRVRSGGAQFLGGLQIPQPHTAIVSAGERPSSVRREGHAADRCGVSFQALELSSRVYFPEAARCRPAHQKGPGGRLRKG